MFGKVTALPSDHHTTLLKAQHGKVGPGANLPNELYLNFDHILFTECIVDAAFDVNAYTRIHFTTGRSVDVVESPYQLGISLD